ncbi:DUF2528 family protein [Cupriavidus necator]
MANWTRYILEYGMGCHEVIVELDDRPETEAVLHEINNFFGWAEAQRSINRHGSLVKAVLAQLCVKCMTLSMREFNVVAAFNEGHGQEGWPKLDGSEGIRLVSVEEFYFEEGDVNIRREDGEDD